jgi:hypothetical protein
MRGLWAGRLSAVLILVCVLAGCTSSALIVPGPAIPSRPVTKLLVFIEENHSLSEMVTAIRHPSLPNYLAIAGGSTFGVTDDAPPASHPVSGQSVFEQAIQSGHTAGVFADGMAAACQQKDGGTKYAVRHNPWTYFANERADCQRFDRPIGDLAAAVSAGTLPNVGMVVPNTCNDAHDCPLGRADDWFANWMTRIFAGPDWKSGQLAVVLTADEDDRSANNTVLTVVIHPSQKAHIVSAPLTHYSLTRLYEDVVGATHSGSAASAPSMSDAFGLPLP